MHPAQYRKISIWLLLGCSLLPATSAWAEENGLIETLTGYSISEITPAPSIKLKFGGWVEAGFTGNPGNPRNGSNFPVAFNDKSNQFKLHQVYTYIEKEIDTTGNSWDIGIRADILYGADARFVTTKNFDSTILGDNPKRQLVFPQVYLNLFAPIGNGISLAIGHFYTIIGYESVPAPNNFFFSHAYTMRYGEPFTHMGIMLSYPFSDNLSAQSGVVTRWDTFSRRSPDYMGGLKYVTDDKKTVLTASLITGDIKTGPLSNDHNRTMYSIELERSITDKLRYALQHDFGVEEKTSTSSSAIWYGINQYLLYDISSRIGAGLRFEWFHDKNGTRVIGDGRNEDFIGITAGVNYKPIAGITVRSEVRYDLAVHHDIFRDSKDNDQLLLSTSAILHF